MGAKLTKNKSVAISKTSEELSATVEQAENKPPVAKKAERKVKNKNSSKTKVDKSTSTDNCTSPSSVVPDPFENDLNTSEKVLVTSDIETAQVNAAYQPETFKKQIQELQDMNNKPTSKEHHYQLNTRPFTEEVPIVQS